MIFLKNRLKKIPACYLKIIKSYKKIQRKMQHITESLTTQKRSVLTFGRIMRWGGGRE